MSEPTPEKQKKASESPAKGASPTADGALKVSPEVKLIACLERGDYATFNRLRWRTPGQRLDIVEANFQDRDLSKFNFTGVKFQRCLFQNAKLIDCRLDNVDFVGCCLGGADLTRAIGSKVQFAGGSMPYCKLEEAQLLDVRFYLVEGFGINLRNSVLSGRFENCYLGNVAAEDANFARTVFVQTTIDRASLQRANLKNCRFMCCEIIFADFEGSNLCSATLTQTTVRNNCRFQAAFRSGFSHSNSVLPDSFQSQTKDAIPSVDVIDPGRQHGRAELIDGIPGTSKALFESSLAALRAIPNSGPVVRIVEALAASVRVNRVRAIAMLPPDPIKAPNLIFMGEVGSGMAQIPPVLAKVYFALGLAEKDLFAELPGRDFLEGYVAQTGPKTRKIMESALGGTIYIRKVDDLLEQRNDFGAAALDEIAESIKRNPKRLIVILDGTEAGVKDVLKYFPEIRASFYDPVLFEQIVNSSLVGCFVDKLTERRSLYSSELLAGVDVILAIKQLQDGDGFGGLELVAKIFDRMVQRQSARLLGAGNITSDRAELMTFKLCDLPWAEMTGLDVGLDFSKEPFKRIDWVRLSGNGTLQAADYPLSSPFPGLTKDGIAAIKIGLLEMDA